MALRPEFALGHSEYNPFLFSVVDDEEEGESALTVLTVLTRLGIDPWQEAARLSDLPREIAAQSLAKAIATLPRKACEAASLAATATRLVNWLPPRGASTGSTASTVAVPRAERTEVSRMGEEKSRSRPAMLLFWVGLAIAGYLVVVYVRGDNNLEPAGRAADVPTEQLNR
jgi:hypothetical protein